MREGGSGVRESMLLLLLLLLDVELVLLVLLLGCRAVKQVLVLVRCVQQGCVVLPLLGGRRAGAVRGVRGRGVSSDNRDRPVARVLTILGVARGADSSREGVCNLRRREVLLGCGVGP